MCGGNPSALINDLMYQVPEFARGTQGVIRAIAAAGARGAVTVIGGEGPVTSLTIQ